MSIAARQCREYLEDKYPGVRISRRSCRDTDSGGISQHSAYDYGEYDSNALDIMGGPAGWSWDQNVELIEMIVADLRASSFEWSIAVILWQIPDHFGHAHVDFLPRCMTPQWCGNRSVTPTWRYSTGTTVKSRSPEPENGRYQGEEEEHDMVMSLNRWVDMLRQVDIEQMGKVGILTSNEVPYYVNMLKSYKNGTHTFAEQEADWVNLRDAVTARSDVWV